MRYHYEKPEIYVSNYGETYVCDHPVYDRCTLFKIGDTAAFQPRDKGDKMDRDRPVVDGRDIFESKLQDLLLEAWAIGTSDGENDEWSYRVQEELYPKLHELVISHLDGPTSDVGAQDETA